MFMKVVGEDIGVWRERLWICSEKESPQKW
jgi:hypothetical protein